MEVKTSGTRALYAVLAILVSAGSVRAQQQVDPTNPLGRIIYPAGDQTAEQQQTDQLQCYSWASERTGLDPFAAYQQALQAQSQAAAAGQPQGEMVRGAAGGAAMGAIIGAIAGDAGTGAAIGAASGGLMGGMRRANRRGRTQQQAEQSTADAQAQLERWDQAFAACLEGRGYTVR
jgi:hypothetical protein